MITSYEVGAVFRVVNAASPELAKILAQIRELNASVEKARLGLAELGKGTLLPKGMAGATAETESLAMAWRNVAKNAAEARAAIGSAAAASGRLAVPAAAVAASGGAIGGGGGRHRPGWLGGGGAHITGPGMGIPGGGHVRFGSGRLSGAAMAGAGLLGWGIDQAAKTQDYVFKMEDISGAAHDEPTHVKFRKLLQDFQTTYGFNIDDAGKASLSALRQFQGVPGNGVDTLEEILSSGAVESRRKGSGLNEAVESGIGLAHQFRTYDPAGIRDLMATFAALSTADPRSLTSMKRASGYAVPTLSSIGVDPSSVLLAGTALARAGVDSTKSGTWIREAVTRAMPGIVLGHSASNKKHEEALKALGLVDKNGKPTWFTNGRPDELKMLSTASEHLQGMSPQDRAAYGRAAFGAQGFGAVSVLGDPKVNEQMRALAALTQSKEYRDRYNSFNTDYTAGSTVQDARRALAEFNVTMGELARTTLPAINNALGGFRSALEGVRNLLPGGDGASLATVGGHGILGAGAGVATGAAIGALGGPIGAGGGALIGGALGVAEGYMEALNKAHAAEHGFKSAADEFASKMENFRQHMQGSDPAKAGPLSLPPISLSLNLDGRTLAQAMSTALQVYSGFPTQAPAADGLSHPFAGDHNFMDK